MFQRLVLFAGLVFGSVSSAIAATPLDTGNWYQIARMSDANPGMFDGNNAFDPAMTFGTYTSTNQVSDFHRPFSVFDGMEILFVTGDQQIWAQTLYSSLKSAIDLQAGVFGANITFVSNFGTVSGNVLSRGIFPEDPWIALANSHVAGITSGLILWGENRFSSPAHEFLKNTHGGVNVFVSQALPTPGPIAGAGLPALMLLGWSWMRRRTGASAVQA